MLLRAETRWKVLTGRLPFHKIKHPGGVVSRAFKGERPERGDYDLAFLGGVDVWPLLEKCWVEDPTKRPLMKDVVQQLGVLRPDLV